MSLQTVVPAAQPSLIRVVVAASIGNAVEWYDFLVFGYFAPQIAHNFFPAVTDTRALLATFGTFGVAFLARPLGAAVLGGYADRAGRRASLTASIVLMTLGTLLMTVMPGYRSIGLLAPLGILVARLIQGFSVGGEFGGATALMIEHSPTRRGFLASFQFTSQIVAAGAASGLAWLLSTWLGPAALQDWGFRVAFGLGLVIGPVGLYVRRSVPETPEFLGQTAPRTPVRDVLRRHPNHIVLAAGVIAAGTAGTYVAAYLPTYAQRQLHMAVSTSFAVAFLMTLVELVVTPIAAWWSDRSSRLPIMMAASGLLFVVAAPAYAVALRFPSAGVLAAALAVITALRVAYSASAPALLAEMFPVEVRAVGMSLGYTLGVVCFGGFAGYVLTWVMARTGNRLVPGYYLAVAAGVTFGALWMVRRRVKLFGS